MMEKVVSRLLLLFSLVYFVLARQLSFGAFAAPKAGFLPVLAGSTALVLAAILAAGPRQPAPPVFTSWRKLLLVIIGLLAYVALFSLTDYMIATFMVMLYLLKVTDTAGWLYPCLIAAVVAGGFHWLFGSLLDINLP